MTRILFVCQGNICRSPMAELVLKDLIQRAGLNGRFFVSSAGVSAEELGNPVYPLARQKLAENGIDCAGKTARVIRYDDYAKYELIIAMDAENLRTLRRLFDGDPQGRLHLLLDYDGRPGASVADPWYTRDFDRAWQDIYAGCFALLRELCPHITLDFSLCGDRAALFAELRRRMLWQDWYGETLDALHDILTGLPHLGKSFSFVMPSPSMPESAQDYARRIYQEFLEAGLPAEYA